MPQRRTGRGGWGHSRTTRRLKPHDAIVAKAAEANLTQAERIGLHRMDPQALLIARQALKDIAEHSKDPRARSRAAQFIMAHDKAVMEYEHPQAQTINHNVTGGKIELVVVKGGEGPA